MTEFKPGMNWHDLQGAAGVDQLLAEARDGKLAEVAIVGRDKAGCICIFASHPNADAVIGLLMRGVTWLTDREQLT